MRLTQQPIEEIAEKDDAENGDAPDGEQQPRHVLLLAAGLVAAMTQQQRQHQAVANHDCEGDGVDDHHGGGADKPPTNASSVMASAPFDSGNASTKVSASNKPLGRPINPAAAIGTTNRLISTR